MKKTHSEAYVEDHRKIDILSRSIQNQVLQLNKQLTQVQIKEFAFRLNEPTEEIVAGLTFWQKIRNKCVGWLPKLRIFNRRN